MPLNRMVILSCLLLCRCTMVPQDNKTSILFEKPGYAFPYQLAQPDQTWEMPGSLVEISGVSYIDEDKLACIQDELGTIFIYDLKAGGTEESRFGENGDYEDIVVFEDEAWVLKSNGTLYCVTGYRSASWNRVEKYPTALSGRNNTEGLCFDPVKNDLLIACKEEPFLNDAPGKGLRAVYRFSLSNKQLDPEPFLLIDPGAVPGAGTFQSSGIAVHPVSRDLYVLCSTGKVLLVFSGDRELLAAVRLDPNQFPQPEGICFSPEGKLYIASEGKGRPGKIMAFPAASN